MFIEFLSILLSTWKLVKRSKSSFQLQQSLLQPCSAAMCTVLPGAAALLAPPPNPTHALEYRQFYEVTYQTLDCFQKVLSLGTQQN